MMRPKQRKLDIGAGEAPYDCGNGKFDESWIGIDNDPELINHPCHYCGEIHSNLFLMPAERLNFPDEYFDWVHSGDCIGKMTEEVAYDEMFRVLKKGGKFSLHTDIPWLGDMIRQITKRHWRITKLEVTNEDNEILSVRIEGTKVAYGWE